MESLFVELSITVNISIRLREKRGDFCFTFGSVKIKIWINSWQRDMNKWLNQPIEHSFTHFRVELALDDLEWLISNVTFISSLLLVKHVFPTFFRNAKISIPSYEMLRCEMLILAF